MSNMWEYVISFLESVFWICFQTEYHGKRGKGAAGKAGGICVILLLKLNIWIADRYARYSSYTFLIDLLGLFQYSEWFLEGTWTGKLFSILLFYVGLFSCNFICMAAFRVLFSVPVGVLVTPGSPWRVSFLVTTKVLLFLSGILVLRKRKGMADENRDSVLLLLIPGLTVGIACMLMELFVQYYNSGGRIETIVILLLLIVGLMVVCFYLLRHMFLEKERMLENEMLRRQMELQEKSYGQMQSYLTKSRKLHHDMKHKLVVAEQLLRQGQTGEGERYLRHYLEDLEGIGSIRVGDHPRQTVILMKKELAKERGIVFHEDIQCSEVGRMEEMDLCVLLGNLLDNALEAEEAVTDQREVRLVVREEEGRLWIRAENYISKSVLRENRELRTTKPEGQLHGLGIRCMRKIVKRYGGRLEFRERGSWFIVEAVV